MDASEAARLLASLRKVRQLTCPECGKEFEGRGRRKYCSRSCARRAQSRAWYWRHRDEVLARQRRRRGEAPPEYKEVGDAK